VKRERHAAKDEITRARAVARLLELSERSEGMLGEKTWTRDELHERHPKETGATSLSDLNGYKAGYTFGFRFSIRAHLKAERRCPI
jgi:hypothetical protein